MSFLNPGAPVRGKPFWAQPPFPEGPGASVGSFFVGEIDNDVRHTKLAGERGEDGGDFFLGVLAGEFDVHGGAGFREDGVAQGLKDFVFDALTGAGAQAAEC